VWPPRHTFCRSDPPWRGDRDGTARRFADDQRRRHRTDRESRAFDRVALAPRRLLGGVARARGAASPPGWRPRGALAAILALCVATRCCRPNISCGSCPWSLCAWWAVSWSQDRRRPAAVCDGADASRVSRHVHATGPSRSRAARVISARNALLLAAFALTVIAVWRLRWADPATASVQVGPAPSVGECDRHPAAQRLGRSCRRRCCRCAPLARA